MAIKMNQFRSWTTSTPPDAGKQFDMTLDGRVLPPRQGVPLAAKLGGIALLVAVLAGAIGIAAIALWLAMVIVPVAVVAGAVAYGAFCFQMWRNRGSVRFGARPPQPWGGA